MDFKELYSIANNLAREKKIEEHTYISEVAVALVSEKGNIYTGRSIKTTCALGLCAENVAVANMIINNESVIKKMLAVYEGGKIISPCGKCREFMYQINHKNMDCEIMIARDRIVKLKDLLPESWSDMK